MPDWLLVQINGSVPIPSPLRDTVSPTSWVNVFVPLIVLPTFPYCPPLPSKFVVGTPKVKVIVLVVFVPTGAGNEVAEGLNWPADGVGFDVWENVVVFEIAPIPVLLSLPGVNVTTPVFGFIFDIPPVQSSNSNWYAPWVDVTVPLSVEPALS